LKVLAALLQKSISLRNGYPFNPKSTLQTSQNIIVLKSKKRKEFVLLHARQW